MPTRPPDWPYGQQRLTALKERLRLTELVRASTHPLAIRARGAGGSWAAARTRFARLF
jgi:hypothetical protein